MTRGFRHKIHAYLTRIWRAYDAHLYFFFFAQFSKFCPIFKILTHFQYLDPFSKILHISKFLPHFKLLTHFPKIKKKHYNFNQISKTLQFLKMLTYLLNDDTFFKMLEFLLVARLSASQIKSWVALSSLVVCCLLSRIGDISTLWCFRPYKPYIFWKLLVQVYQNWYYQVSHT